MLRVRRIIENVFGNLFVKWWIFRKLIKVNVDLVDKIIKVIVCLYNYFCFIDNVIYILVGFIDSKDSIGNILFGDWCNIGIDGNGGLNVIGCIGGNRYLVEVSDVRDVFKDYFNSVDGEVDCLW